MNIQSAGEAVFLACEMEKQAVRLYERALLIFRDEKPLSPGESCAIMVGTDELSV